MDNWVTDAADPGFADIEGDVHYLRGDSPVFSAIVDFGVIPAGMVGPYSDATFLRRGTDLVTTYAGTGDLQRGIAQTLLAGFGQVTRAVGRQDRNSAAAGLTAITAQINAGLRSHACSPVAAAGLTALVDAVLAAVSPDVFAAVTPHAQKSMIVVGETVDIWATGEMRSGRYVNVFPVFTLTSVDPKVAEVVDADTVRALSTGTADIRASATQDGVRRSGDTSVPVVPYLLKSLQIAADTRLVTVGKSLTLSVTGTTTAGNPVTFPAGAVHFTSADESVATVDTNDTVTGVATGTVVVSATAVANGLSVQADIGVMASATPSLPAGWSVRNLGATVHGGQVPTQGAADYADGTFRVMTDGANIWNDDATFLCQTVTATDATVSATFTAGTGSGAGYGVVIRDGNAPDAHEVHLRSQDGGQLNLVYRNDQHPNSSYTPIGNAALPVQLRLTKSGDQFTAYQYRNGGWQQVGTVTATMGTDLQVGIGIYASAAMVAEVECTDVTID